MYPWLNMPRALRRNATKKIRPADRSDRMIAGVAISYKLPMSPATLRTLRMFR